MLARDLKRWYASPTHTGKRYNLVMHTSVLKYSEEDLRTVYEKFPFQWILPKNILFEIQLLEGSEKFRKKAKLFLALWKNKGSICFKSNLEDFYGDQKHLKGLSATKTENLIFIFGDQLKLKEFLENVPANQNYYILYHNRWHHTNGDDYGLIEGVDQVNQWIPSFSCVRNISNMYPSGAKKNSKNIPKSVTAQNYKGEEVASYLVKEEVNSGGEAKIYNVCEDENILLKLYDFSVTDNRLKKLKYFQMLNDHFKHIAMPKGIIYMGKDPIGISMERIKGRALCDVLSSGGSPSLFLDLLPKLAILLLELNCMNIMMVDLSLQNLIVGEKNDIYIVDADSFQYRNYSSGVKIRADFLHKDYVGKQNINIYDLRCQDFAFAVLIFRLLVCGTTSPLFQSGAQDAGILFWGGEFEFPYGKADTSEKVNKRCFERWNLLPEHIQQAFVDEFTFNKEYSVGYWIDLLDREC